MSELKSTRQGGQKCLPVRPPHTFLIATALSDQRLTCFVNTVNLIIVKMIILWFLSINVKPVKALIFNEIQTTSLGFFSNRFLISSVQTTFDFFVLFTEQTTNDPPYQHDLWLGLFH